jgi:hypothetical protein
MNTAILQDRQKNSRHIEATDGQIDRLVYELYDLTEEEIRIVKVGKSKMPLFDQPLHEDNNFKN